MSKQEFTRMDEIISLIKNHISNDDVDCGHSTLDACCRVCELKYRVRKYEKKYCSDHSIEQHQKEVTT